MNRILRSRVGVIFLLVLINLVVHWRILAPNVISYGDFDYFYSENLSDLEAISPWNDAVNYGGQQFAPFREPLEHAYGIIGTDKHVSEKLLVIFPALIAGAVAPYLLVYELTRRRLASVVAFIVFNFNTYFLVSSEHFLLYAAASFAMLGLYGFTYSFRVRGAFNSAKQAASRSRTVLLVSLLPFFISSVYDFRMTYIAYFVAAAIGFVFMVTPRYRRRSISRVHYLVSQSLFWFLSVIVNSYWLFLLFGSGSTSTASTGRPLFGDQFWGLDHAISLHHPFWTFGETVWFTAGSVPYILWLLPVTALVGFLYSRTRVDLLFLLIAFIGIFLVKQSDAPFPGVYQWLYDTVPGFSAFREATKFYFLIVIGYTFLIGRAASAVYESDSLKKLTWLRLFIVGAIIAPFVLSTVPIMTGSHGSIYQPRSINPDYLALRDYIEEQDTSYRVLWAPAASIWAHGTSQNPSIHLSSVLNTEFAQLSDIEITTDTREFFNESYADYILDYSSVKYVIVPLDDPDNADTTFTFYSSTRLEYISTLDSVSYLQRVTIPGVTDVVVYENFGYLDRITAPSQVTIVSENEVSNTAAEHLQQLRSSSSLEYLSLLGDSMQVSQAIGSLRNIISPTNNQTTTLDAGDYRVIKGGSQQVWARYQDGVFTLSQQSAPLPETVVSAGITGITSESQELYRQEAATDQAVAVVLNSSTMIFVQPGEDIFLGRSVDITDVSVALSTENALVNGDFSDGPWQDTVQNCNNYDDNPQISSAYTPSFLGDYVTLQATRHTACLFQDIEIENVVAGVAYLQFEARAFENTNASVALLADNQVITQLTLDDFVVNQWEQYSRSVVIPEDVSSLQLYIYAQEPDDEALTSIVDYRNVAVIFQSQVTSFSDEVAQSSGVAESLFTSTEQVEIQPAEARLGGNIVQNGDFSEGLWQEEVGNCFNYDDNPILSMNLIDGAVELSAERHTACTSQVASVEESGLYRLEIEYDVKQGDNASVALVLDQNQLNPVLFELPTGQAGSTSFSEIIIVPASTKTIEIFLYSRESTSGPNVVAYDNVALYPTEKLDDIYITKTSSDYQSTITQVRSAQPHQLTALATVSSDGFHIIFNNLYDTNWDLFIAGSDTAVEGQYVANGLFNGWFISADTLTELGVNEDGVQMLVELRYSAQSVYSVLYYGSLTTLLVVVGYVLHANSKRYNRYKVKHHEARN